jgi:hypothetical protein
LRLFLVCFLSRYNSSGLTYAYTDEATSYVTKRPHFSLNAHKNKTTIVIAHDPSHVIFTVKTPVTPTHCLFGQSVPLLPRIHRRGLS